MIDLYTAGTPNGKKISIALEELALPYRVHALDLQKGEQRRADYLAINPNGKIPAIVDGAVTIFESGAILIYLADRTGRLLPKEGAGRYEVIEWLMFQMSAVGPMLGQLGFFARQEPTLAPALERYRTESLRILDVLDKRLADREHLAGEYSIADVATYPWIRGAYDRMGLVGSHANLDRWLARVGARPAVARGMKIPA